MRKILAFVLLLGLAGCATYKSQMVNVEPIDMYKNKVTVSDIMVAAEPFDTADKAKSAFYIDLAKKDIKPIQLVIENGSADNILVQRSRITLVDSAGNETKRVNAAYVFDRFEKNELAYAFWGFGIFSYMSAEKANEKMKADWYEKELVEEKTLTTKRNVSGFVFFETKNHLKGMTLSLDVLNLRTNEFLKIEVPIS